MHSQEKHVASKILKYFCDDKEKQLKILGILYGLFESSKSLKKYIVLGIISSAWPNWTFGFI